MRMNETINTMPEYERLRADYEKRLQEVEQNYQKQLIQMADEAKRANMAKTDFLRRMSHDMRHRSMLSMAMSESPGLFRMIR